MTDSHPQRTIIITGVSPTCPISTQTAFSFASNATHIALIGPNRDYLASIASELQQKAASLVILSQEADITSPESLGLASHNVRSQLGAWDVFIHNPGAHAPPHLTSTTIRGADEDIWWGTFERNVRSLHFIARHFFPKMKSGAVFLNLHLADLASIGPLLLDQRASAEEASSLAAVRVVDHLAGENESSGLRIINVFAGSGRASWNPHVVSRTVQWCTDPEAAFLHGRCIDAADGLEYYKVKKDDIMADRTMLRIGGKVLK